jgi:hypothetical protein
LLLSLSEVYLTLHRRGRSPCTQVCNATHSWLERGWPNYIHLELVVAVDWWCRPWRDIKSRTFSVVVSTILRGTLFQRLLILGRILC